MPTASSVAAELSPRQREILDTARHLLESEGVEALTLGRIALVLGIKTPSLYKHFAGKRELEALLIAEGLHAHAEALERAPATLRGIAAAYRQFALARPELYRLMTAGPLDRDLLPDGLEARAAAPLLRVLADEDLARAAWSFAHGMVVLELAGRFPPHADLDAAWACGIDSFARAAPA
jgi:AcrR family transcriptional regulator